MPHVSVNGVKLWYLTAGNGSRPVVFVHGFCQSSAFWKPTLDLLPDRYRGFALDLRGFGDSGRSDDPYSIPGFADELLAFLEELHLSRIVLVGNSMGGVVCQSFATRYAHKLSRLVLVSTGASVSNPGAAREKADHMETMAWDRAFFETAVRGFFARPPENADELVEAAMKADRRAMVESTRSSASLNFLKALRRVSEPTLIVQGEKDAGRTPEDGRRMQEAIRESVLHVLPEAGHTPMLERPDLFHPIFLNFLGR